MIRTERLDLVPATADSLRAELDDLDVRERIEAGADNGAAVPDGLARVLGAEVPSVWPPDLYDRGAIRWMLDRMEETADLGEWWMYYVILKRPGGPGLAVGAVGYKGPPADGVVEIGYGVATPYRRMGYATEASRGLIANAFRHEGVSAVIAETLPDLTPSIGVLENLGFEFVGEGSEEGVIRYRLDRSAYGD